jgi:hypothetical protein
VAFLSSRAQAAAPVPEHPPAPGKETSSRLVEKSYRTVESVTSSQALIDLSRLFFIVFFSIGTVLGPYWPGKSCFFTERI